MPGSCFSISPLDLQLLFQEKSVQQACQRNILIVTVIFVFIVGGGTPAIVRSVASRCFCSLFVMLRCQWTSKLGPSSNRFSCFIVLDRIGSGSLARKLKFSL